MKRLFGRNNPEADPKTAYRMESDRVMQAVSGHTSWEVLDLGATHLDEVGAYEAWMPITSVFMELAVSDKYKDISIELSRIESKVVFSD